MGTENGWLTYLKEAFLLTIKSQFYKHLSVHHSNSPEKLDLKCAYLINSRITY